jgi:glutamate-1-semialdehyde 2,1-aminomutase
MKKNDTSIQLFEESRQFIPGGVNSPVRAFKSVGLPPRFIRSGNRAKIVDEDGNEFIDYVSSWGPLILGHAHPEVLSAVAGVMEKGTSFGAPTRQELEMAKTIAEMVPGIEMARLVNSGTEAVMSAVRLARGFTGRDRIIKFSGCYHGHSDGLLVRAGSGAATLAVPDSLGVPHAAAQCTSVAQFNNLQSVRQIMEDAPDAVAAVVVEPVAGNMGVVAPGEGFLDGLRVLCDKYGALLIFDEVITGFRLSLGGAQEFFGVQPDLTCLGKIIGGGLPVGAFGGPRSIMSAMAPVGGVYQAGTLSGNPLAVAAGLAVLRVLRREDPYSELDRKAGRLADGIGKILADNGVANTVNRVGSMFSVFFHAGPVNSYEDAMQADKATFIRFFAGLLDRGIYIAASPFEAWFVSMAHTDEDIDQTLDAVAAATRSLGG